MRGNAERARAGGGQRPAARFVLRLSSEPDAVGPAIDRVIERIGADLEPAGGPSLEDDLRICLAEALNNCIEHGYAGMPGRPIWLRAAWVPGHVQVEIRDLGAPPPDGVLDASSAAVPSPEGLALADLPEGGWGWMLIRRLARRVALGSDGDWTVLRLEFGHG